MITTIHQPEQDIEFLPSLLVLRDQISFATPRQRNPGRRTPAVSTKGLEIAPLLLSVLCSPKHRIRRLRFWRSPNFTLRWIVGKFRGLLVREPCLHDWSRQPLGKRPRENPPVKMSNSVRVNPLSCSSSPVQIFDFQNEFSFHDCFSFWTMPPFQRCSLVRRFLTEKLSKGTRKKRAGNKSPHSIVESAIITRGPLGYSPSYSPRYVDASNGLSIASLAWLLL